MDSRCDLMFYRQKERTLLPHSEPRLNFELQPASLVVNVESAAARGFLQRPTDLEMAGPLWGPCSRPRREPIGIFAYLRVPLRKAL
jgi:hypothetical protein